MSRWGIYIHVPWCRIRCPYCAFHVVPGVAIPPGERFATAILKEFASRHDAFGGQAQTLFFGGGTPSQLAPNDIATMIKGLPLCDDAEVSMEVNPEDVTATSLSEFLSAGVNRISVGIQTLSTKRAKRLGRAHTVSRSREALERVASSDVRSWSADLIFGLPDSNVPDLEEDLAAVCEYEPPHIAVYGLTIESGTPFAQAVSRGRMSPLSDEQWRTQYDALVHHLKAAGLERYEVSNFAKPGHECRHNQSYWTDMAYMGLGPSAHGFYPDGRRYRNAANTDDYLRHPFVSQDVEHPTSEQAAMDYIASAIRARQGVSTIHLAQKYGLCIEPAIVAGLVSLSAIVLDERSIRLTEGGYPLADSVASRLVEGLMVLTG